MLSATEILAIPANYPENLFTNNLDVAKKEFHELGKIWHPDVNKAPDAEAVFQHISSLYKLAKTLIGTTGWKKNATITLKAGTHTRILEYYKKTTFELGDLYLGKTGILYGLEKQYIDLFNNAKRFISEFKYADIDMEREMSRFLPKDVEYFASADRLFMYIPKTEDVIILEDVVNHTKLEARHLGWIQNSIYNIACYLNYSKIVHGDISLKTVFISPKMHSSLLLGGWWYASNRDEKFKALPKRSIKWCPPTVLRNKLADSKLDLELIKATGREILGDASGVWYKKDASIPSELIHALESVSTGDALSDYSLWKNYLKLAFGTPKFIDLKVDAETIYGVHK